jgi:hypothetical protein
VLNWVARVNQGLELLQTTLYLHDHERLPVLLGEGTRVEIRCGIVEGRLVLHQGDELVLRIDVLPDVDSRSTVARWVPTSGQQ